MFVGDPTPDDLDALREESRARHRDNGDHEAVRDGVSIARLVDAGDMEGAAIIADQYALSLDDLAAQLVAADDDVTSHAITLIAAGYRIAAHCNAGDHAAAGGHAEQYGVTLPDVLAALS